MVEATRRRQIEDVASGLFRDRGYPATSVRDIARALDIQGASLYAHVASKEDVLWAIVVRAAERFESALAPIIAAEIPAGPKLRRMCHAHVEVVTDDLRHAAVFLREWRFLGQARREEVRRMRDRYEGHFRDVISAGVKTGELAADDPALAGRAILSALNGIADWYRPDGRLSAVAIAGHYADLLAGALESSPTKSASHGPAAHGPAAHGPAAHGPDAR
jgi:AcrR family transcriptional regulator